MPGSTTYRARWILPITRPPIEHGWIRVAGGRVIEVGSGPAPDAATDLGDVALLPGLVNAHTHLELSWMAGLVPPAATMSEWVRALMRLRRGGSPGPESEARAAVDAARSAFATGTALVGDVSNLLSTPAVLRDAGLGGVIFHELLGFAVADPAAMVKQAWLRVQDMESTATDESAPPIYGSVVAHAPYSVSAALLSEIARAAKETPLSVHLAESSEEIEFLRTGRGPIRSMLEDLGVWTDVWRVPECDPVQYLSDLKYLLPGTLVVHGVHLSDDGLERLRRARAVLVTCPRSNVWVGAGPPRLAHFYASGVPVAVGTDSLASAATLNLFDELAEMRRIAPEIAAASLLESATRVGARALGLDREFGTLAAGKRADIVSVRVPAGVRDVEEYLVGGLPPESIGRLAG